ncbi:MAG TPA: hypothetical protein VLT83_03780 [Opitutaceae bacterium]|nr:hypothetical protein [Opitutaceae bacterium]
MIASLVILLILALTGGAAVLLVRGVRRAPEGYEDAAGFHLGPTPPVPVGRAIPAAADASEMPVHAGVVRFRGRAARDVAPALKVG